MNDWELLQSWVKQRSEAAFAELVRRYLDFIYGSALRQVGDPDLAQDVTQAVFLVLARKASALSPRTILSGWLFRTTLYVSARARRTELRRQFREHQASLMRPHPTTEPEADRWSEVEPHLDAALADLAAPDREALLLRYFKKEPLKALGDRLGISEEAAKKRVSRAVDRLRGVLSKRGVSLTPLLLAALLNERLVGGAPEALAGQILLAANQDVSGSTVTLLVEGTLRDLAWNRFLGLLPWCAAVGLLVVGGVWWFVQPASTPDRIPAASTPLVENAAPLPAAAVSTVNTAALQPGPSKLVLNVRAEEDQRPLVARLWVNHWRRGSDESEEFTTDANGMVEIAVDGSRTASMTLWVDAPGYVPISSRWRGHECVEPVLYHTCYLKRGQKFQGFVRDESGALVSGARITFNGPGIDTGERDNVSFHPRLIALVSDNQGRFQTDQAPLLLGGATFGYSVEHADYVSQKAWIDSPESLATNHVVTLRRGLRLRGRVVDPQDNPVASARVSEERRDGAAYRKAEANGAGEFEIGPFAPGEVRLSAAATGFQETTTGVEVGATTTNLVLRLAVSTGEKNGWERGMDAGVTVRVRGRVTDAETGEALARFRVRLDEHRGTANALVGMGHDGRFDWPVFMAFFEEFSLDLDADGYEPAQTDVRPVESGEQTFEVRMRRANNLAGQVVTSEGRPVAGALVGLNGEGFGWMVLEGKAVSGNGAPQSLTDGEGRFSFKPMRGAESVLVVHDLGCTLASVAELKQATVILRPWGAITGTLVSGGKPMPSQKVSLDSAFALEPEGALAVNLQAKTTTDAEGRFRFNRVPAGPVLVQRYHNYNRHSVGEVGFSHGQRVVVPPDGTAEVTIGGQGRSLVGRLALSPGVARYDWRDDLQLLEEAGGTEPVLPSGTTPTREFHRAMQHYWATAKRYYLEIRPDGSFRIDDVAPGNYVLKLHVAEPPDPAVDHDVVTASRRPLGRLTMPITVGEGATSDVVDLGAITIPVE